MDLKNLADYLLNPLVALVVVIVSTVVVEFLGVWQLIVVGAFVGGLLVRRPLRGLLIGAIGVSLTWLLFISYYAWTYHALIIAGMFVQVLGLPETFSLVLALITLVIGGLLGGFSGLTGSLAYTLVWTKPKK